MEQSNPSPELIRHEIDLLQLRYSEAMKRDARLAEKKEIRQRIRQLTETLNAIYNPPGKGKNN